MQTRMGSFVEAWANVAVGFGLSFVMNLYLLPFWGYNTNTKSAFEIGVVYTVASLIRSYGLRRFFNWIKLWRTNAP